MYENGLSGEGGRALGASTTNLVIIVPWLRVGMASSCLPETFQKLVKVLETHVRKPLTSKMLRAQFVIGICRNTYIICQNLFISILVACGDSVTAISPADPSDLVWSTLQLGPSDAREARSVPEAHGQGARSPGMRPATGNSSMKGYWMFLEMDFIRDGRWQQWCGPTKLG